MARRGWGRSIITALVAAAGVAAAQLGLGYGLGIITWSARSGAAPSAGAWSAALVWTTWIAATSVVIGAVVSDRTGGSIQAGWFARTMWRLTIALAATLGALVTIPLVAVPASGAQVDNNYAPHLLAGVYAAIGVLLGLLVAPVAVAARAVAANVIATAAWLWVLAIIAVIDGASTRRGLGYAQLGVWKFTNEGPTWHAFYIPGALLMLGSALLIGGLAAFPAAGRGAGRVGVAISGAAAPLLVAAAYVLVWPDRNAAPFEQTSAFITVPYMVVAGLAGSLLVAALGGPPRRPARSSRRPGSAAPATAAVASTSTTDGTYYSRSAAGFPPALSAAPAFSAGHGR